MSAKCRADSVAIIGAGIAGLSCARVLSDHGLQVTVFEKSRGPGGRMSTRRSDYSPHKLSPDNPEAPWQCDHGAQYFTARDPLFMEQAKQWETAGVIAGWRPRVRTIGQRPNGLENARTNVQRFVGLPGMTSPARQLAEGLKLHTGARVTAIALSTEGWFLTRDDDVEPSGPFRHLALAVPAQQAADLLQHLTSHSEVSPAVTQTLVSCRMYALRPCWALMLHFNQTIDCQFDAAFVNATPGGTHIVSWLSRDNSKPGRGYQQGDTWLVHASPLWSEQHLEMDQQPVIDALLTDFRLLTGIHTEPSATILHRWRFAQTGETTGSPGQLWWPESGLGLCGDWLNGGRVEGAWLSGYQLAEKIIAEPRAN